MTLRDLDRWFPPCGPCAFCGHEDARHRLWDNLIGMHDAGSTAGTIAADYELPAEAIQAVLEVRPYRDSTDPP